ncbi:MAG: hypothetical protein GX349_06015 [Firmicutes bacterium]|nr:hypothetical protein [Bacillota bacterium]
MFAIPLGMGIIALLEVPKMLKKKQWGELIAFAGLWLFATLYAFLVAAEAPLPSPTNLVFFLFGGRS